LDVNEWLWAVFAGVGLAMILIELAGVDTGFDLIVVGSILVLSGLVTLPFHSWVATTVTASVLCVVYVFAGRRYVRRLRTWKGEIKTGADALIGQDGLVTRNVTRFANGSVRVGNEEFRAKGEEKINEGEEIVVVGIKGTTLIVKKKEVT
jgi:membrane protein implicated in regulation of membrane protease activity